MSEHELAVDIEISDGEWFPHLADARVEHGFIDRVGNLPRGMQSGLPAFQLLATLDDGTKVVVEASWRNMSIAMVALIAHWGTP
jgi:hypothetical protein